MDDVNINDSSDTEDEINNIEHSSNKQHRNEWMTVKITFHHLQVAVDLYKVNEVNMIQNEYDKKNVNYVMLNSNTKLEKKRNNWITELKFDKRKIYFKVFSSFIAINLI